MGAVPPPDLPASRSSAIALPVQRIGEGWLPALLTPDPAAERRVIEFFTAHIRNPHTRKACARAAGGFAARAERHGIAHLREVEPVHGAAYVEELQGRMAAASNQALLAGLDLNIQFRERLRQQRRGFQDSFAPLIA